jgi:hypothetical protein
MFKQFVIVALTVMLGGCVANTYQAKGVLRADRENFSYRHVAISPGTADSVQSYLTQVLKEKGFTVYSAAAFDQVLAIKPGYPVAVFICKDAGRTDRGLGSYSQSVACNAYDLHSKSCLYQGVGEYMGMSVVEDYLGALRGALVRFPHSGSSGQVLSVVDLPLGAATQDSDRAAEQSTAIEPEVTLLGVYLARPDAEETAVNIVQPGDTVEQIIHYKVSGGSAGSLVLLKEHRSILHNDVRLTDEVYEKRKSAGIYRTKLHITLPEDAAPGEYVLEAGIIYGSQVVGQRFEFSIAGQ